MVFTICIDCDNDAFQEDAQYEVRRILKELVVGENGLRHGKQSGRIMDVNGNTVGTWQFDEGARQND